MNAKLFISAIAATAALALNGQAADGGANKKGG